MTQEQTQDEIKRIEINEKQEPIDLDAGKPEPEIDENDPRAAIYKKHSEKRRADGEGTPVGSDKQESKPEEPVEAKPVEEPKPEEEVLVKVNGKERKVPKSKIEAAGGIEAYRKNAAASELLNQAAAERREIEAQKLQLEAQAQEIQREREELQRTRQKPVASEDIKALAQQYHEAILDGEIDKASDLLIQMQAARGDSEEIAKRAAAEARAALQQERAAERKQQFEAERRDAVEWFESEFPDISEDQELRSIADRKTIELLEANPNWGPRKIVEESARMVRDWMGNKGIGKLPSDKLEAKRGLSVVKGGSARAVPRQTSKLPTNSQYIENLRKSRGLDN